MTTRYEGFTDLLATATLMAVLQADEVDDFDYSQLKPILASNLNNFEIFAEVRSRNDVSLQTMTISSNSDGKTVIERHRFS